MKSIAIRRKQAGLTTLIITFLAVAMGGCASLETLRNVPVKEGVSRDFTISYPEMKRLTLRSIERLDVNIEKREEDDKEFIVEFIKPLSGFSWGEFGRVVVMNKNSGSRVLVFSERRFQLENTGMGTVGFANAIFRGIEDEQVDNKDL